MIVQETITHVCRMIENGDADDHLQRIAAAVFGRLADGVDDQNKARGMRSGHWPSLALGWAEARKRNARMGLAPVVAGCLVTTTPGAVPMDNPVPIPHRRSSTRSVAAMVQLGYAFDGFVGRAVWSCKSANRVVVEIAPEWMQSSGYWGSSRSWIVRWAYEKGWLIEFAYQQVIPLLCFGVAENWAAEYGVPPGMIARAMREAKRES